MVCTLTLKYRIRGAAQHSKLLFILSKWGAYKRESKNGTYYYSKYQNMQFWLHSDHLDIKGSLAKFLLKNNIEYLSREQIKLGLDRLSHLLQVNIYPAEILRLDIGICFFLKYPVVDYLNCFQQTFEFSGYLNVRNETRTYYKNNYSIVLYDKVAEIKESEGSISSNYSDAHILRIELQLKKRLAQQLNRKIVYVAHLLAPGFLSSLIIKWHSVYSKINTCVLLETDSWEDERDDAKAKKFVSNVEASGGRCKILEMSERDFREKRTSINQKKYFRKMLKKIYSNKAIFQEVPILAELNTKVENYVLEELQSLRNGV